MSHHLVPSRFSGLTFLELVYHGQGAGKFSIWLGPFQDLRCCFRASSSCAGRAKGLSGAPAHQGSHSEGIPSKPRHFSKACLLAPPWRMRILSFFGMGRHNLHTIAPTSLKVTESIGNDSPTLGLVSGSLSGGTW